MYKCADNNTALTYIGSYVRRSAQSASEVKVFTIYQATARALARSKLIQWDQNTLVGQKGGISTHVHILRKFTYCDYIKIPLPQIRPL